ncbi:MAG: L,D-transpeptidase family protein [Brevibacterium sp.]|uniref:L,D-transpeptidase family protein n=1 Tax=Brevibacterium sandarakinum TaxID=629680 RepID=UPI00264CBE27|nr:L,D-transpeptidase family protein [Brevibacterium sandarakinum]MDN5586553.1 L,D-transpeptidase family protein [Brevibacterium sp.]MDN5658273.1 L,D-transpeptidase family protein [Brevibacterium sandarakinum]
MFSGGTRAGTSLTVAVLALTMSSCATPSDSEGDDAAPESAMVAAPSQQNDIGDFAAPAQMPPPEAETTEAAGPAHSVPVPGLGPETSAQIPAETSQVLVASGPETTSDSGQLSFFAFADDEWKELKTFDIHNGKKGWLADRREGDKTSPIGVFTLSDAGGYEQDPGTKLSYTQDERLPSSATAAYGSEYERVFDYIIAIDYNRVPGTAPTDGTRPLGWDKGGGIWLHVDHDSGTNGCVTLKEEDLLWILETIDPDAHPRIAMGPESQLQK